MKNKEIEIKWHADHVKRQIFNEKLKKYLESQKFSYTYCLAEGPDYYYSTRGGDTARHRCGGDKNELTVKTRIGRRNITVRNETNIELAKETTPIDIARFFSLIGFEQDVTIYKSCDIYFIKDGKAEVDIVWYRATSGQNTGACFMEVEVGKLGQKESLRVLSKWSRRMKRMFGIEEVHKSSLSLYELHSGRRYKSV